MDDCDQLGQFYQPEDEWNLTYPTTTDPDLMSNCPAERQNVYNARPVAAKQDLCGTFGDIEDRRLRNTKRYVSNTDIATESSSAPILLLICASKSEQFTAITPYNTQNESLNPYTANRTEQCSTGPLNQKSHYPPYQKHIPPKETCPFYQQRETGLKIQRQPRIPIPDQLVEEQRSEFHLNYLYNTGTLHTPQEPDQLSEQKWPQTFCDWEYNTGNSQLPQGSNIPAQFGQDPDCQSQFDQESGGKTQFETISIYSVSSSIMECDENHMAKYCTGSCGVPYSQSYIMNSSRTTKNCRCTHKK